MANLSINKREAIYYLIKTIYVIVFILKSMVLVITVYLIFLGMYKIIFHIILSLESIVDLF